MTNATTCLLSLTNRSSHGSFQSQHQPIVTPSSPPPRCGWHSFYVMVLVMRNTVETNSSSCPSNLHHFLFWRRHLVLPWRPQASSAQWKSCVFSSLCASQVTDFRLISLESGRNKPVSQIHYSICCVSPWCLINSPYITARTWHHVSTCQESRS